MLLVLDSRTVFVYFHHGKRSQTDLCATRDFQKHSSSRGWTIVTTHF